MIKRKEKKRVSIHPFLEIVWKVGKKINIHSVEPFLLKTIYQYVLRSRAEAATVDFAMQFSAFDPFMARNFFITFKKTFLSDILEQVMCNLLTTVQKCQEV